jgi:hypothetical protein
MMGWYRLPSSSASSHGRLQVVEELEEHHPGEQRQTIGVAIEALVLAQDLAGAADQGGQVFAGGERCLGLARRAGLLLCRLWRSLALAIVISVLALLVQGALQAGDGVLHAAHAAEVAGGDFGRTAVAVEGLDLHQLGQRVELQDAALDVAIEAAA